MISNFKKQFDFSKSQEKTVSLLADELSELLREDKIDTTKDLKSVDSPEVKQNFIKESLLKTFKFSNDVFCIFDK
ncbi:hypothetical protein, partial [Flavobacterium sp.]|uniref:hypothetical protein n=1 Tax=Flavobacterium sp. TaxID=239 RepID=UPI0025BE33CE